MVLVHYVDTITPDLLRTTVASAVHEYYILLFTILLMFFHNVCQVGGFGVFGGKFVIQYSLHSSIYITNIITKSQSLVHTDIKYYIN